MNETLKEYSGFIHHAAEIYDANDAQLAAMAAALGVNPKRPVRPVQGGIFTNTHGEGHNGIDLALPAGSPIVAAVGGTVITDSNDGSQNDGYGNFVKILGDDGNTYYYAHMSNTADRADGSRVEPGEVIGYVGSTGNSTGNHLHFEIRDPDGRQLNPEEVHPDIW
jgi:murein DD-endopeptidase MepM/ murein hydrolase activator NlpD